MACYDKALTVKQLITHTVVLFFKRLSFHSISSKYTNVYSKKNQCLFLMDKLSIKTIVTANYLHIDYMIVKYSSIFTETITL